jgi:hypothetical protein
MGRVGQVPSVDSIISGAPTSSCNPRMPDIFADVKMFDTVLNFSLYSEG